MKEEDFNDLISLGSEDLTAGKRREILAKLNRDPEMIHFLDVLSTPVSTEEPLEDPLVFPISGKIRLGVQSNGIRIFNHEGSLDLGLESQKVTDLMRKCSRDQLPLCFLNSIRVSFDLECVSGIIEIATARSSRHLTLSFKELSEREDPGHIEIWEEGTLLQSSKTDLVGEQTPFVWPFGKLLTLKHTGSPFAVGLYACEVELKTRDWVTACVAHCIKGRISESLDILKQVSVLHPDRMAAILKLHDFMDLMRGWFHVDGTTLVPAPLLRSSAQDFSTRLEGYRHLWRGIVKMHPTAAQLKTPWNETGQINLTDAAPTEHPTDLMALIQRMTEALQTPPSISWEEASRVEPEFRDAWAAFYCWSKLNERQMSHVMTVLQTYAFDDYDPFGLQAMQTLLKGIPESGAINQSLESREERSHEIWKFLMELARECDSEKGERT